jgi:hypothetical protein
MSIGTLHISGTRNTWPIVFNFWHGWKTTGHGPQSWPWWRLISFKRFALEVHPPSTTTRLWYYTRWVCGHVDLSIDRRAQRAWL